MTDSEAGRDAAPHAGAPWRPVRFIERVGAALVAPRRALAAADAPEAGGRAGSDAAWLIALAFLATHTREVVLAGWLALAEGLVVGLSALLGSLSRAVTMDLAFLCAAGIALTLAAGRKRAMGRDFDLACVAFVPIATVDIAATLLLRLVEASGPSGSASAGAAVARIDQAASILAYGWALVVLFLAWRTARARPGDAAPAHRAPAREAAQAGAPAPAPGAPMSPRSRARWAGRLLLGGAAALLAVQSLWLARNLSSLQPVSPGDPAPPFALRAIDEHGAVSARMVHLEDLRGQVVLLDFWATWCKPCVQSMPVIERIYQRHHAQGLVLLSINLDDPARARAILGSLGGTLPLFADDGATAERYKVSTIPHLVLIDRLGMVRHVHRGMGDEAELDQQVRRLLGPPPS